MLNFPPVTDIDPEGKLILIVGSEKLGNGPRKLKVSFELVRHMSPVWEELLMRHYNKWPGKTTKIQLPTEDPEMLIAVLRIAHLRFHEVPKQVDFYQLVEIAQISNRYRLNHLLLPFLPGWIQPYQPRFLESGFEQWLFIAYQFGFEKDYKHLAKHLALHCTVDHQGQLFNTSQRPITGVFPPHAIGE